jgi:AcrR family transcriptional regulator
MRYSQEYALVLNARSERSPAFYGISRGGLSVSKDDLIVLTAIRILTTQNYRSMTTSTLAQEAGIAEGTIYCYFKSKKELFTRVLQDVSEKLFVSLFRGIGETQSLRENLLTLGRNFFQMDGRTSDLYKILYKAFSEVEDDDVKKELGRIYTRGLSRIREMIQWSRNEGEHLSDSGAEMILIILWGIGDMLWKRLIISNREPARPEELEVIVDFICEWLDRNRWQPSSLSGPISGKNG